MRVVDQVTRYDQPVSITETYATETGAALDRIYRAGGRFLFSDGSEADDPPSRLLKRGERFRLVISPAALEELTNDLEFSGSPLYETVYSFFRAAERIIA